MPSTINQRMGAELEGDFVDRHVDLPVEGFNEEIDTACAVHDAMDLNCAMHKLVEDEVGFNSQNPVSGFFEVDVKVIFRSNADTILNVMRNPNS